jgi:hypothetical protein
MSTPASFLGIPKESGNSRFGFVLFCFAMLLGSPATGQSEANGGRLASQDTIELKVSGWNALAGGVAEASLLNNTFTIDSSGELHLPMIGRIQAAGLRTDVLAKLIADRLQAESGVRERAVTTVQRMQPPASAASSPVAPPGPNRPALIVLGAEEPAGARPSVNGSSIPGRKSVVMTQPPLKRERPKADAPQRGRPPAPIELATAERRAAPSTQAFGGARTDLEAARAQAAQEASAASRARQAAELLANEQRELATRERAKGVALEHELLAARREIDALKGSVQAAAAERDEARRALAAMQQELDATRRGARDGSAQARAVADKQERALEGQRQIADGLARELAAVQREVEGLKVSLVANADRAAAAQAIATRDLQAAEAAAKRLGEALLLERQRADAATGELNTARQEGDGAKQEALRLATAQREALEDEQAKAISLARELAATRKEVDFLKAGSDRRIAHVEDAPTARASASASAGVRSKPRSGRKSELREVRKTEVRRSSRSVALPTPPLPAALLPTQPIRGLW